MTKHKRFRKPTVSWFNDDCVYFILEWVYFDFLSSNTNENVFFGLRYNWRCNFNCNVTHVHLRVILRLEHGLYRTAWYYNLRYYIQTYSVHMNDMSTLIKLCFMETLPKRIEKKNFGTAYWKLNVVALETKSSLFNNCIHNPARPWNHNQINVFYACFFFGTVETH